MTNLVFVQDGGHITGDADYNIQAKSLPRRCAGQGLRSLAYPATAVAKKQLGGALTFDLHASGTTAAPQVNGKLALKNLTLNGQTRRAM